MDTHTHRCTDNDLGVAVLLIAMLKTTYTYLIFSPSDYFQEETMTMERILLQTIKFDLQVEHPYSFLLSFAKQIKGERN